MIFLMSFEGDPVIITVGLWVLSIDSINVVDMVWRFLYFATYRILTYTIILWIFSDNPSRYRIPTCLLLDLSFPPLKAWLFGFIHSNVHWQFQVELPTLPEIHFIAFFFTCCSNFSKDYKLDFFLRQLWTDPRLSHDWNQTLALSNTMLDKIWVPDTYFENSKSSKFHKVTMVNKLLSISPDGGVHYNAR